MARIKKSIPREVQNAQQRVAGMNSIEDKLDLGNGVSVTAIEAAIKAVTDQISAYNMALSSVDQMDNDIAAAVKSLSELSSRALKGCEFKYGRDSNEYEMLGGTRSSDRKKPVKKTGNGGGGNP